MQPQTTETKKDIISLGVDDMRLAELREEFKEVPDANTKDGYAEIKTGIGKLRKTWVEVDKEARLQKEAALLHQRGVNNEKDRVTAALKEIAEPFIFAKKEVDEAAEREKERLEQIERERIGRINAKLERIRTLGDLTEIHSVEGYQARLDEILAIEIDDSFEDSKEAAIGIKHTVQQKAEIALIDRRNFEAEQAENIRKRKELDEREAAIEAEAKLVREEQEKKEADLKQQLEESDRRLRLIEEKEDAEKLRKIAEVEQELAKKAEKKNKAILKARLPEDQKVIAYVGSLLATPLPEVKSEQMISLLSWVSQKLVEIDKHVIENTQKMK